MGQGTVRGGTSSKIWGTPRALGGTQRDLTIAPLGGNKYDFECYDTQERRRRTFLVFCPFYVICL